MGPGSWELFFYFFFGFLPFPLDICISFAMGVGAILEPLVVIVLLFGGTWINRVVSPNPRRKSNLPRAASSDSLESGYSTSTKDGLLGSRTPSPLPDEKWHKRQIGLLGFKWEVTSPNTAVFQDRILSRLLRKFPFLVECWYWALVYWVGFCSKFHNHPPIAMGNPEQEAHTRSYVDLPTRPCLHRRNSQG